MSTRTDIHLPYQFTSREYQKPLFHARNDGQTRFVLCWHRRAGKDKASLNFTIREMVQRVGAYYYFLPTYAQAKKIIWEGIGKDGFKLLDHFPRELIKRKNDSEMLIELVNGSIFRCVGSDNYDSVVGTNPVGCVFSEYALQNPRAWDFIRPILLENGGWALWVSTPRGHNHFHEILATAKANNWFSQVLTVDDTGIITHQMIQEERNSGMTDDLIQQEYYCSFEASIQGAYYSQQIKEAREQRRLCKLPYEPGIPVHCAFDLGIGDSTAILFYQVVGKEIRIIHAEEHSGEGIAFYVNLLRNKPYKYGTFYLPHDAEVRELGTGKSRLEVMHSLGLKPTVIIPAQSVDDGIQAVRSVFPRLWIDERLGDFIEAITQYRKEYDEDKRVFKNKPLHDWSSHYADALRYLAQSIPQDHSTQKPKPRQIPSWAKMVGVR